MLAQIVRAVVSDQAFIGAIADAVADRVVERGGTAKRSGGTSTWSREQEGEHASSVDALTAAWAKGAEGGGRSVKITGPQRRRAWQVLTDASRPAQSRTVEAILAVIAWGWTNTYFTSQMITDFPAKPTFAKMASQCASERQGRGKSRVSVVAFTASDNDEMYGPR